MSANLTLLVVAGVLLAAGTYLIMERSLTRVLVGILLASNGVNIVFLVASGPAKAAPFVGSPAGSQISDPLPQALVLTAIVITLGLTAFLLTMAYRSFQIDGHDEVQDDVEDRQIRDLAESDLVSLSYDEADRSRPSEDNSEPVLGEVGADDGAADESIDDENADDEDADDEGTDAAEQATDAIVRSGEGRGGGR